MHLFTLGFLTTSILGALYQFLPVALGVSIRSKMVAHASFGLLVLGVGGFATASASASGPRSTPGPAARRSASPSPR